MKIDFQDISHVNGCLADSHDYAWRTTIDKIASNVRQKADTKIIGILYNRLHRDVLMSVKYHSSIYQ